MIKDIDPELPVTCQVKDIVMISQRIKNLLDSINIDDNHGGGIISTDTLKNANALNQYLNELNVRIKIG